MDLVFAVVSASLSGLLKAGGTGETRPLIKGGGPLGLVRCDELVGLITERDINGGGPSGLTDPLALVPGGDVSVLGLRDMNELPWPPTEMERGVELALPASCMILIPVMGMSGGGLGTSPVVIPYRGAQEPPGDVRVGLGGDVTPVGDILAWPAGLA